MISGAVFSNKTELPIQILKQSMRNEVIFPYIAIGK